MNTVSFEGLGIGPITLNPIAFTIGPISVHWYGIIMALAFVLAFLYIYFRSEKFGVDRDKVFDVAFVAGICGLVGARIYYVVFSDTPYGFLDFFKVWEGGMAIYGGIIGGLIGFVIMAKIKKMPLRPVADVLSIGVILAQGIGRWGNFVNIEAFGGNTTSIFGMSSPKITAYLEQNVGKLFEQGMIVDPNMPVHPCFLYESVLCILGFVLLHLFTKHRRFDGQIFLMYIGYYGLVRFFIEGTRTDSLMWGPIRVSQILGLCCFVLMVVALAYLLFVKKKYNPDYLVVYATTEDSKLELAAAEEARRASTKKGKEELEEAVEESEADFAEPADEESPSGETPADETPAEEPEKQDE